MSDIANYLYLVLRYFFMFGFLLLIINFWEVFDYTYYKFVIEALLGTLQ